ncbi:hypothetical protein [Methanosarcina barkeri]|uniref:hypothetical protein n=1 Tax=Methanosarcina barkeri TaxID=2208 RepID=UPI00373FD9A1
MYAWPTISGTWESLPATSGIPSLFASVAAFRLAPLKRQRELKTSTASTSSPSKLPIPWELRLKG